MLKSIIASVLIGLNSYAAIENDKPVGDEYTVTVCHIQDVEKEDGNVYTLCENYKDAEDYVWLDGVHGAIGDMLKVTYKHDDPISIEKVDSLETIIMSNYERNYMNEF